MAPLSDYVTGTITLTNGSAAFTGSGTGWLAASFREGDTILGIEDNPGVVYVIESITDNDAGTLTQPWQGATGTYEYRMRYLADGQRVTAQARTLIELLGNGNLQALAGLSGTPNTLAMFTGAGAMVEVARTDLVSGANYDVQVDTLPDRDAYDGQDAGFAVLVSDTGDGRAAIYSKLSAASGDWSGAAYVTGPAVTLDVGSVTPVAFGNDPDVTLNPVAGGYEFDFELPENATFQSGSITTLDPGEDATFSLSPVAGGYALNLGVPRGPAGDIDGVTPFYQNEITTRTTAEAARAGLGALGVGEFGIGFTINDIADFTADSVNGGMFFRALAAAEGGPGVTIAGIAASLGGTPRTLFIANQADGTPWFGDKNGTDAVPTWRRGFKASDLPSDLYRPSNILGIVSQSGGLPTGAIIERGSNSNGEYVRYADGTQICTRTWSITVATSALGSIHRDAAPTGAIWTFPAVFSAGPTAIFAPVHGASWCSSFQTSTTDSRVVYYSAVAQSTDIPFCAIAIGRWF